MRVTFASAGRRCEDAGGTIIFARGVIRVWAIGTSVLARGRHIAAGGTFPLARGRYAEVGWLIVLVRGRYAEASGSLHFARRLIEDGWRQIMANWTVKSIRDG